MYRAMVGGFTLLLFCGATDAAEIKVLSAGAIEPSLHKAVERFRQQSGHEVKVQFNTAPQIAQRMQEGYVADVVIAPPTGLKQQAEAGRIAADGHVTVGKVGIGIVVRKDASNPTIGTAEEMKSVVLGADSVVFNTASTGLYLERLFERLGIADQIKDKSTRPPSGEAVMQMVIGGSGKQIGFGAITEIKLFEARGIKFVGPLPADIQNYTTYSAALTTNGPEPTAAKAFIAFLGTLEARQLFAAAGVE
jgi:molybdate transport system substrate-binding protein